MNIPDHYPKYVISMDEFNAGTNDKGIKQLHVRDFLKMEIWGIELYKISYMEKVLSILFLYDDILYILLEKMDYT